MALTKTHNRMIAGSKINVLDFGAIGDGVSNDTAAVQSAVDNCPSGGTVFFPTGTYLCNVTTDRIVNIEGEGVGSILKSFSNNEFAFKYDGNYGARTAKSLKFDGNSKNTHGLYVNTGSSFTMENVLFTNCGLALTFNGTIDTRINQCFFESNYVGVYYTTRTLSGNPTISDVNSQNYTITNDPQLAQQPGESGHFGTFFNLNDFAVIIDQPDNPFIDASNIKFHGGLIQQSRCIGFLMKNGGGLDSTIDSLINATWMEGNGSGGSRDFDGVTYTQVGDVLLQTGGLQIESARYAKLNVEGGLLLISNCTAVTDSVVNKTGGTIISNNLRFGSVSGGSNSIYSKTPFTVRVDRTIYTKARSTSGETYKYSSHVKQNNKLLNADTLTFFGSGSASNAVDGVLDTQECKEASITVSGNGPVIFTNTGGTVANKYYVGLVSLKYVSGSRDLRTFNSGGGAAFGASTFSLGDNWETFCFLSIASSTVTTGAHQTILTTQSSTSTVRVSAASLVELDSLEQVYEFLDTNSWPLS